VPEVTNGLAVAYLPAAALDLATHPFPAKVLQSGESAVAAARVESGAQVPDKHRRHPPSLKFDSPRHSAGALQSGPESIKSQHK